MSSVMLGAFLGTEPSVQSAAACCAFVGIAGELASEKTDACGGGTMTFRNLFIISTVAYAGIYKISGMEGLLITTVVMDVIAVVCSFYLRSESSKTVIADRKEVQILAVFKNKKAFLFVISLAIFSIAWLLINFFYVEKIENCGLPVEWMSLIILSYSAVQMLAEPILGKLSDGKNGKSGRKKLLAVTAVTAGVAFLLFGSQTVITGFL